jgi:hypothetical protein
MNNKKLFSKTNKAGFVFGAVLLAALTESASCAGGLTVGILSKKMPPRRGFVPRPSDGT